MTIPIPLSDDDIAKICKLVQQDMWRRLGYSVKIIDATEEQEHDINFRLCNLRNEDMTEEIQNFFTDRIQYRMLDVKKIYKG